MILLLLTCSVHSPMAWHAVKLATAMQQQQISFKVFLFQDSATIANHIQFSTHNPDSLLEAWQKLQIDLPICVSTALSRGVADVEHKHRHHLLGANLAEGFRLTGLGELAEFMNECQTVIQL